MLLVSGGGHVIVFLRKKAERSRKGKNMAGYTYDSPSESQNWQTTKSCLRERNKFMFNNELLSDVYFVVGKTSENRKTIPGHKFVLAISSPVFFAMFYGRMADQKKDIAITDCEPDSFLELLRYIYYDGIELDASNVLGTLYLAKKYIIPFLADKCIEFLENNIDYQNAFTLLAQARYFCAPKLEEKCWEIIDRDTSSVLSTESFTEIDHDTLMAVLARDKLTIQEFELFKAAKKWAEQECERRNLPHANPENMRKVMSSALNFIRFPVMTLEEFSDDAAQSGILTPEETINIFLYFGSKDETKVQNFPTNRRLGAHRVRRCSRFPTIGPDWACEGTNVDSIKFTVDREVAILGVGLYGISQPEQGTKPYSVDVELLDSHNDALCSYNGSYPSDEGKKVHDVLFDEAVTVQGKEPYIIRVVLKGPQTLSGTDGMRDVMCDGIRFRFDVDEASFNGTTTADGQIPDIIIKIP